MEQYVGLDVSQKETAICVIDAEGTRVAGHVSLNPGCNGRCRAHESASGREGRDGDRPTGSLTLARAEGGGRADCVHPCSAREGSAVDANQQDRFQ